ncbi:hypothetical protein K470DRAFT_217934 [Piedraia hortae CBS 480.64]|uniref:Urease accessory protein UreD n=1 Tax=Piedraia hortae CBS 480.64 TaxID=1314780 RepID=A0A6A7BZ19_9PEZI|nr:hypothetical protein K470DRAFT_217934 [Piedraia hortae CBS 480.64]
MPHKHTRRHRNDADFDLQPSVKARPLSTFGKQGKPVMKGSRLGKAGKRKRKSGGGYGDDTPKAFIRLMEYSQSGKRPSGLDDGAMLEKKMKIDAAPNVEVPKPLPGEHMGDYSARVDKALPVAGLVRKGKGPQIEGVKERQTRTERRLHKLYDTWREEEARLKEKEEERKELEEEAEDEQRAKYGEGIVASLPARKGKRKRGTDGDEDDPWKMLKEKRPGPKSMHDVVDAPPSFTALPKEKLKMKGNAKVRVDSVPAAAGSLKRREELSRARRETIETYRAMIQRS